MRFLLLDYDMKQPCKFAISFDWTIAYVTGVRKETELGFLLYRPFSLALLIAVSVFHCQLVQGFTANAPQHPLYKLQFIRALM